MAESTTARIPSAVSSRLAPRLSARLASMGSIPLPLERAFTTQKGIGGKATEPNVGVGDRDGVPSLPIADGTGISTGGLGAHP